MKLDQVAITIRPRTAWQAMDMGICLARKWFKPLVLLWLGWALPLLGLLALLGALLPGALLQWVGLGFLLLHPLGESLLIAWIGPALFGKSPGLVMTWRNWYIRSFPSGWWPMLRGRINPLRPFSYCVLQLERLSGKAGKERLTVLTKKQEPVVYLSFAALSIEVLLSLAMVIVIVQLIPAELRWFSSNQLWLALRDWLLPLLFFSSCLFFVPFYVCCGFMLYISRRITLEAWDIELGFKALEDRLTQGRNQ